MATGTWNGAELTVRFSAPMMRCDYAVPRSPTWWEPDMGRVQIDGVEILGVPVDPRDLPADVRKALAELAYDVEFSDD
ncbi:hypothetical protein LV82_02581 [Albidovulum inexpectatum]|uniref:Uncharacterized protein n=1 Tax=Albidovulum inexpectatum TaxID=196587 RepID=A0A2S5JEH0_9RHOB|nr:hypothetical protein [Albidovulum inexpectatum]PPB79790.1 hypothetical protein LV82_02581 [Albidovulum inexpectatum]